VVAGSLRSTSRSRSSAAQLDKRLRAGDWRVAPIAIPQERHHLRVGRLARLGVPAGVAHRLRTAHALSGPTLSPLST
jgi:hypothetical protein